MELGKAYVQIVPSAEGIKGSIENVLDDEAEEAGASAGSKASGKFGKALSTGLKVAGAGIAAAAAGVGAIGKQAVSAYADFEQLSGGIETLFGKDAPAVMAAASGAFATAGMSANQYMETAISSSAALITSLGGDTEAAAALMDVSITDMADNVNKMGTDMEAVQNAYRGFSRGNFTMLDNLALGFAGTKEGMQQLLDKAEEFSGVKYDIDSYADIVQAIHVVQTQMGITGTTAKEGAATISGSLTTLKAAWSNLLAGLADPNADQSKLISNLTQSAKNVATNLIPVIRTVLPAIGSVVGELAPVIAAELPALVTDVLPGLVEAAVQLALALGQALATNAPAIIQTLTTAIVSNAPALLEGGVQLIVSLASGLIQAIPQLLIAAGQLLVVILEEIGKGVVQLADAGLNLVRGLWEGIKGAAAWLWQQISGWLGGLWDDIKGFFGIASPAKATTWAGEMLVEGLARGIDDAGDDAVAAAQRMNAGVLSAIGGDGFGMNATASSAVEIRHTGTIRVEGVNDRGELVAVTDILYDTIVERLRREARYA